MFQAVENVWSGGQLPTRPSKFHHNESYRDRRFSMEMAQNSENPRTKNICPTVENIWGCIESLNETPNSEFVAVLLMSRNYESKILLNRNFDKISFKLPNRRKYFSIFSVCCRVPVACTTFHYLYQISHNSPFLWWTYRLNHFPVRERIASRGKAQNRLTWGFSI